MSEKSGLLECYEEVYNIVRVVLTTYDLVFTPGLDDESLNPALELGSNEKLSDTRRAARYYCRELTQVHAQHLRIVPTSHPVQCFVRKLKVLQK